MERHRIEGEGERRGRGQCKRDPNNNDDSGKKLGKGKRTHTKETKVKREGREITRRTLYNWYVNL
jgi:hypothetical protein